MGPGGLSQIHVRSLHPAGLLCHILGTKLFSSLEVDICNVAFRGHRIRIRLGALTEGPRGCLFGLCEASTKRSVAHKDFPLTLTSHIVGPAVQRDLGGH